MPKRYFVITDEQYDFYQLQIGLRIAQKRCEKREKDILIAKCEKLQKENAEYKSYINLIKNIITSFGLNSREKDSDSIMDTIENILSIME